MINQAKTAIDLEEPILELVDSVPANDEKFDNDEESLIEKQKYKNKISEELLNQYFQTLSSSVLPF